MHEQPSLDIDPNADTAVLPVEADVTVTVSSKHVPEPEPEPEPEHVRIEPEPADVTVSNGRVAPVLEQAPVVVPEPSANVLWVVPQRPAAPPSEHDARVTYTPARHTRRVVDAAHGVTYDVPEDEP